MGNGNTASGDYSVATGWNTSAIGDFSFSSGYSTIANADYSFAVGNRSRALHEGTFVFSDSQNSVFQSTTTDEASFRFANGYKFEGGDVVFEGNIGIGGGNPFYALDVTGDIYSSNNIFASAGGVELLGSIRHIL